MTGNAEILYSKGAIIENEITPFSFIGFNFQYTEKFNPELHLLIYMPKNGSGAFSSSSRGKLILLLTVLTFCRKWDNSDNSYLKFWKMSIFSPLLITVLGTSIKPATLLGISNRPATCLQEYV